MVVAGTAVIAGAAVVAGAPVLPPRSSGGVLSGAGVLAGRVAPAHAEHSHHTLTDMHLMDQKPVRGLLLAV